MPINNTIVSYTNLIKPFGNDQNALLAKTQDAAAKVITDSEKLKATMAGHWPVFTLCTQALRWQPVAITAPLRSRLGK